MKRLGLAVGLALTLLSTVSSNDVRAQEPVVTVCLDCGELDAGDCANIEAELARVFEGVAIDRTLGCASGLSITVQSEGYSVRLADRSFDDALTPLSSLAIRVSEAAHGLWRSRSDSAQVPQVPVVPEAALVVAGSALAALGGSQRPPNLEAPPTYNRLLLRLGSGGETAPGLWVTDIEAGAQLGGSEGLRGTVGLSFSFLGANLSFPEGQLSLSRTRGNFAFGYFRRVLSEGSLAVEFALSAVVSAASYDVRPNAASGFVVPDSEGPSSVQMSAGIRLGAVVHCADWLAFYVDGDALFGFSSIEFATTDRALISIGATTFSLRGGVQFSFGL